MQELHAQLSEYVNDPVQKRRAQQMKLAVVRAHWPLPGKQLHSLCARAGFN